MVFDGFKMEYSSHLDVKCNNRTGCYLAACLSLIKS